MNFKWWLKYTVKVLLTPSCWIRNYQTSKTWDKHLHKLLEENKWRNHDGCKAYLGNEEIWVSNHPYASFSPFKPVELNVLPSRKTALYARDRELNVLPSRKTALYAMDRLEQDLLGGS